MPHKQIQLCEYGCGQEAKFQFKNGKWSCSKYTSQCPELKKRNSKTNKGRIITKEHRKKMSEANKGINHPNYGKHCSEKTRKKMSEGNKGKTAWNKGLTGIYSEETIKKNE